eukprot:jgi/Bigna1/77923/fgenesh1_pg.51_\
MDAWRGGVATSIFSRSIFCHLDKNVDVMGHTSPRLRKGLMALVLILVFATIVLRPSAAGPHPLGGEELEIDRQSSSVENVCVGWKPDQRILCGLEGCQRLIRALQDENCMAALKSEQNAQLVGGKIAKLSEEGAFTFFRGADGFFFWEMKCAIENFSKETTRFQRVLSNGDTHPENFGVMQQANGQLVWGTNDFDQAMHAPFTWDFRRGATGFALACMSEGFNSSECSTIVEGWINGYAGLFSGSCTFKNGDRFVEGSPLFTEASWAAGIGKLLQDTRAKFQGEGAMEKWFQKKGVNLTTNHFVASEEVAPINDPKVFREFQEAIHRYMYSGVSALAKFDNDVRFFELQDVAQKYGSGTGSIGLDRYLLLVKGGKYPRIVEMKQVTESVVERYTRFEYTDAEEAQRVVNADKAAYPYSNVFYGSVMFRGHPFILREKNKYKNDVDWRDLSFEGLRRYAYATGRAQALFHTKVSCGSPACKLDAPALVDAEICMGIKETLDDRAESSRLRRETLQFALDEAQRHIAAQNALSSIIRTAPSRVKAAPELLLNQDESQKVCSRIN